MREDGHSQFMAPCTLREVAREEVEEGLHLRVEGPLSLRVDDGADEAAELVTHGLRGDASSRSLEVDVTAAAHARVEAVALGHETVGGHGGCCAVCEGAVRMSGGEEKRKIEQTHAEGFMWTGLVVEVEMSPGAEWTWGGLGRARGV